MRVTQLAVDWKEAFSGKSIIRALKAVGGEDPQCYDYAQDCVDCKIMFVSDKPLTYDQLTKLWEAGDLWATDKNCIEGKNFDELLLNVEHETLVCLVTDGLADEAHAWKNKAKLAKISERVQQMTIEQLHAERDRILGNGPECEE